MHPRRHREIAAAIDRELEGTGITYEFEPSHKHLKVRFTYGHQKKLVVMSSTTSDWRAFKNKIRDVRHAVHELTRTENT